MTDFVDNPYKFILENCSIRNYKGYQQHREVLFELHLFGKVLFRLNTPWLFFATGLKDDLESLDHSCFIAKTDGSPEKVSIDRKNRITIAGKKYADWITYG